MGNRVVWLLAALRIGVIASVPAGLPEEGR
jgi:hypothetical protein